MEFLHFIKCFPFQRWNDEILSWDPDEYGAVDVIRLPGEKIWTPDIILYNK